MKTMLIPINNEQCVIVDLEAVIKLNEWYIDDTDTVRQNITDDENYWKFRKDYHKIIASSYYIDDSIPFITNTIEEIEKMYKDKEIEELAEKSSEIQEATYTPHHKITYKHGFIDGRKSNKAEFTKDDIRKAMLFILDRYSNNRVCDINYVKTIRDYINSLKQQLQPCMCEVKIKENKVTITKLL